MPKILVAKPKEQNNGKKKIVKSILAIMMIGTYSFTWSWLIFNLVTKETTTTEALTVAGSFVGIISTMTVLVTLIVQHYFKSDKV